LLYLFTETLLGFLLQAGHWDELGKLMECVYRVSYSLHNWQAATQWSCELALLAYRRGYRKEMSAWIQKASKSAEHCKDELLKAKLIRLEALLFYVRCEYEEAELSLSRAYDMYKKLDETTGMITVLNDRGELEERLGNIENARGYYSKALQIAEESEEAYRHRGECYNNLGELILLKKNVDESDLYKAKDWFEKALSVAKKFDWRELEASVRWNLAQVYEKAMDYKHSYIYARHSLEIQKQLGIRESEMNKSLNFLLYFADRLTDYETVKFTV
jgi:tetratricopeptide (TPR) repeat protein